MVKDVTVVIAHIPRREELLHRALLSVDHQTWAPKDVMVGTDEKARGAAATRNDMLALVATEWVAFLDDDDELYPDHLERCLAAGEETGADLVYPWMDVIGLDRNPFATTYNGLLVDPFGVEFGIEQMRHLQQLGNFIPITYVARTEIIRQVGGFPDPAPNIPEDYGLLLRLLAVRAKFVHVPAITWAYHFHGDNTGGVGG